MYTVCVYLYVCACVCMHVCEYVCVQVCEYVCVHMPVRMCVCVCVCVRAGVCESFNRELVDVCQTSGRRKGGPVRYDVPHHLRLTTTVTSW